MRMPVMILRIVARLSDNYYFCGLSRDSYANKYVSSICNDKREALERKLIFLQVKDDPQFTI